MNTKTLMFSVALNGYQWFYKSNFKTHESYAKKYGYCYQLVCHPMFSFLGKECAWVKLSLIIKALEAGYTHIMFVDADTVISPNTPKISSIEQPKKSLYAVKGYSGRLNSGMLIIKNTEEIKCFFKLIIDHALCEIPKQDDVGWGENGHLIHYSRSLSCLHYLDQRWNNNTHPELDDYIRHFSKGPLHAYFQPNKYHYLRYLLYRLPLLFIKKLDDIKNIASSPPSKNIERLPKNFHLRLQALTARVIEYYPLFTTLSVPTQTDIKTKKYAV